MPLPLAGDQVIGRGIEVQQPAEAQNDLALLGVETAVRFRDRTGRIDQQVRRPRLTPERRDRGFRHGLTVLKVDEPAKRQAGKKVGSVEELVEKLRNEAKVI